MKAKQVLVGFRIPEELHTELCELVACYPWDPPKGRVAAEALRIGLEALRAQQSADAAKAQTQKPRP